MDSHIPYNKYYDIKIVGENMRISAFSKTRNIIGNIFFNKNICILGVDGTGKSSIGNELYRILGDRARMQYMGNYGYRTKLGRFIEKKEKSGLSNAIFRILVLIVRLYEMWYRVVQHWPNDYFVIYDRYAWDYCCCSKGISKYVTLLLYYILFPKPKYTFYLHCPVSVSLSRKDDIANIDEFTAMKEKFDSFYRNKKSVTSINTGETDLVSVIGIILETVKKL